MDTDGWWFKQDETFAKKKIINVKFIYSEKATKFCEMFTLLLLYAVQVISKVKISQNFVGFSEYMNFINSFLYSFVGSAKTNTKLMLS